MTRTRLLLSTAALACGLGASPAALASPTYPTAIRSHLSLSDAPSCSLCHQGGQTGFGTVTTPFGVAMRDRGLVAEDEASLFSALDKMSAEGVDSDGDGASDIEELVAGTNPNGDVGGTSSAAPPLAYGCNTTIAPGGAAGPSGAGLALASLAAIALASRRRRGALALALLAGTSGCYDVSYVSSDVCSTGLMWTGGEAGSPLMNPGKACIDCHAGDEGPGFTFAGTVFKSRSEADTCFGEPDVAVIVTGADGKSIRMEPNEAGNFYTSLEVALPYQAMIVRGEEQEIMSTPQTSGDCNSCHTESGANGAPGRVSFP
jgi:MYXO-CTERM domain-containing protein